jgi:DNA-binding winged helix-turn-helix (wHTH) protein
MSLRLGDLEIDHAFHRVTLGTTELTLTPIEYNLLTILAERPHEVLSRETLGVLVWGDPERNSRTLDVHLGRLRVKLNAAGANPPRIVAVRTFGYKLIPGATTPAATEPAVAEPKLTPPLASLEETLVHINTRLERVEEALCDRAEIWDIRKSANGLATRAGDLQNRIDTALEHRNLSEEEEQCLRMLLINLERVLRVRRH